MDVWQILQTYAVISVALAGTSYFTLYKPGIELTEEILDEDLLIHRGWLGSSLWLIIATVLSPYTAFILLKNNNTEFIETFAVSLADRIIKDEED